MGKLQMEGQILVTKVMTAEQCEPFARALLGVEAKFDPAKLYRISIEGAVKDQPAAQHQGEPVARYCIDQTGCEELDPEGPWVRFEDLPASAATGEVERLEQLIKRYARRMCDAEQERDTLRARLAERDALLRDIQAAMREYEQGCDQFPPFHHNQLMERISAALSASAEPEVKS